MLCRSFTIALALAVSVLAPRISAQQQPRMTLPPGVTTNAVPKFSDSVITTDMTALTPQQLVQALLGPGVVVSNIVYNGAPVAAGTFQGALNIVGLDHGVVLSSGNIASVVGPNTGSSTSTDNLYPGDVDLNTLTTSTTFDACTLEFDFTCGGANQIAFQFVFSSEEYNEFVGTQYNDVFGFFLNGVNIALLPGGLPVAINNVNCGNPYNPAFGGTCGLFINNSCTDLPVGTYPCAGAVDTEMDGLTVVLTATGAIQTGVNHIKLAIADAGDPVYDSNVFIRGQSFTCGVSAPFFAAPTPCGQTLQAIVGIPVGFNVAAQAATGLPSNTVTLSVGAIPTGASHTPALPITLVGQNGSADTTFAWLPTSGQIGTHVITYTAVDQLSQATSCTITVVVSGAGSGLASATPLGTGCASGGDYPHLSAMAPVLGTTIEIEISDGLPNWFGFIFFSPGMPMPVGQGSGCTTYVDLNTFVPWLPVYLNALGESQTPVSIPSDPALAGVELTFQGLFEGTSDPLGVQLTNGVYVILGN